MQQITGSTPILISQSGEQKFSPKQLLLRYISLLPFFIVSVAICLAAGIIYGRYKVPIYKSSTLVLIKSNNDRGGTGRSGSNDLIDMTLLGASKTVNMENEIELIKANHVIKRTVIENKLNYKIFDLGYVKTTEVFPNSFIQLTPIDLKDTTRGYDIYVSELTPQGGKYSLKSKGVLKPFIWGQTIAINGTLFKIQTSTAVFLPDKRYRLAYGTVQSTVGEIAGSLGVAAYGRTATILQLSYTTTNPVKGEFILNELVKTYKVQNIEDQNQIANNTIKFINERLSLVTQELGGVETNLADFKDNTELLKMPGATQFFGQNGNDLKKSINELDIKRQLLLMVDAFLLDKQNDEKTAPVNLDIPETVANLINVYNTLQLRIARESKLLTKESPYLNDLLDQRKVLKAELATNISYVKKALDTQYKEAAEKFNDYLTSINALPQQEKRLKEITRQQSIKEGLYLYLLQKREETAITTASTASNYRQINTASTGGAIEPNLPRIYLFSIIIGLLIPVAYLYLRDIMNDKVTTRNDVIQKTEVPYLGEIGHMTSKSTSLIVANKSRDIIAEQFRIVRTNLSFLLQDKKVLLITSTMSGEGKSFVSLNLAAVLAISGKKVALLEFDLRKPRITKSLDMDRPQTGIVNFLANQTNDTSKLYTSLEGYENLHLYSSGPIPPNPAELLLSDRLALFIDTLKHSYDFVIVDSAPVGLVGDSFTIGALSDAALYVIRQRYTLKQQIEFIDELYKQKKLPPMGLIMNDVIVGGIHGYYGYGSATYGAQYGYGYGSKKGGKGYFDNAAQKPWWKFWA
jgi:capsular exopolysaccharide synthesis family protein